MDFTHITYRKFLEAIIGKNYTFQSFSEFLANPAERCIILRHDVDLRPEYSLRFAEIQKEIGIKGSYYFRIVPKSYDENIIKRIASLGHEIGYHYETMDEASSKFIRQLADKSSKLNKDGLIDLAMELFMEHLERLRKIADIKTVCMHGSPLSKYDNRDIWKKYNYRDYGITGEPYFDIDFSKVLYLTDTGRRWDGKGSVRDKVGQLDSWTVGQLDNNSKFKIQNLKFHSTGDIIAAANAGLLPDRIMFTFHPQRWTDRPFPWIRELVMQNVKNVVKRLILKII